MFPHDSMQVMPFWQERPQKWCHALCSGSFQEAHEASSLSTIHDDHMVKWRLCVKVLFFLCHLVSLLGEWASLFKISPGDSGVSPGSRQRMAEIHQDGSKKSKMFSLDFQMGEVKLDVRIRNRERELSSVVESEAVLKYLLLGVTGWKINPVWRNVSGWSESSWAAWILGNQVCTGSITFSTLGAEVEKVFSKGHPTLFRGAGDLELWARAALKLCLNRTGHTVIREPGGLGVMMISAAWPWYSVWGAVWTAYLVGVRRQAGGWQIRRMWSERQRTCWHNAGWPERGAWAGSLMWMLMKGTKWSLNKNSQVDLLCMCVFIQ